MSAASSRVRAEHPPEAPAHEPPGAPQRLSGSPALQHDRGGRHAEHGPEPDVDHHAGEGAQEEDGDDQAPRRAGRPEQDQHGGQPGPGADEGEGGEQRREQQGGQPGTRDPPGLPGGGPAAQHAAADHGGQQAGQQDLDDERQDQGGEAAGYHHREHPGQLRAGQRLVRSRAQPQLGQEEEFQDGGDDAGDGQHHGGDAEGGLRAAPDGCERAVEDLADRDRPQRDHARFGGLGGGCPSAGRSAVAGPGLAVPRLAVPRLAVAGAGRGAGPRRGLAVPAGLAARGEPRLRGRLPRLSPALVPGSAHARRRGICHGSPSTVLALAPHQDAPPVGAHTRTKRQADEGGRLGPGPPGPARPAARR